MTVFANNFISPSSHLCRLSIGRTRKCRCVKWGIVISGDKAIIMISLLGLYYPLTWFVGLL